ncbi:MAG: tol-pal system protein YbgF [Sedimenticola thiotaurini]|uniref:Cell division coordinator CpoB n=1 Tax=Sedimenticola thiotaurini TaxID=1543721 RepID=A0A558CV71_9GAMM|nr:MAG: tol-pal system protein YbgF [Sedimenticola thiotaurini]
MNSKYLPGVLVALFLMAPLNTLLAQQRTVKLTPEQEQSRKIELLERKVSAMSDLVLQVDALQREVQQLRGEIEVQNHAMDALKKRQRDLYLDVDQRLNQLSHGSAAAPSSVSGSSVSGEEPAPVADSNPATAAESVPEDVNPELAPSTGQPAMAAPIDTAAEEAAYKQAFGLLMQRRYGEAHQAFEDFLTHYKAGSYTDNAQYWLAEASYVTRDFDRALADFQTVINEYPNSSKVPDAMLKSSFIHYEKKQWTESRELLQRLVTLYPSSTASRLATKRLDRMQAEGH